MLRTPNQIKKLITDLYEGYLKTCRCLTSMRHKNSKLNDEVKKEKEEVMNERIMSFQKEKEKLFDISSSNLLRQIEQDKKRSKEAKEEDIGFYIDQKGERKMTMTRVTDKLFFDKHTRS